MARIRTIKPEFWSSPQVVACEMPTRLLFLGMLNFADDGGVLPCDCMRLKMMIFPGDTIPPESIEGMLIELEGNELIETYEVEGKKYIYVTGFTQHQLIKKPTHKHPLPPGVVAKKSPTSGEAVPNQCGTSVEPVPNSHPPEGIGSGRVVEGNGRDVLPPNPQGGIPWQEHLGIWNAFAQGFGCPQLRGALGDARKNKLKARLNTEGFNLFDVLQAARGSPGLKGQGWFSFDWLTANDTNWRKVVEGNYKTAFGAFVKTERQTVEEQNAQYLEQGVSTQGVNQKHAEGPELDVSF